MEKPKTVKLTAGDRTFYVLVNVFLAFIGLVILIPIWSTITLSMRSNYYMGSNLEAMIPRFWNQHYLYKFNAEQQVYHSGNNRVTFEVKDNVLTVQASDVGAYEFSMSDPNFADYTVSSEIRSKTPTKKSVKMGEWTSGAFSELPRTAVEDFTPDVQAASSGSTVTFKVPELSAEAGEQFFITFTKKSGAIPANLSLRVIRSEGLSSLSLSAYKALLGNAGFILAFWNSLKIFVFGIFTALFLTVPMAYCMSVPDLPGRKILNWFVMIPYLFNIGMIPTYLVVTGLGFTNHIASIFIPGAIGTYNCLIMRGFFEGIPESLKESARIDGAAEWYVLLSIILPLSKPIIMTIALYYGVNFWNDFMHAMLYLNESYLQPLPILLRNILMGSSMNEVVEVNAWGNAPVAAIKAASVFLSAIPMILAYPFIQKYFTKGTMLGSVKG